MQVIRYILWGESKVVQVGMENQEEKDQSGTSHLLLQVHPDKVTIMIAYFKLMFHFWPEQSVFISWNRHRQYPLLMYTQTMSALTTYLISMRISPSFTSGWLRLSSQVFGRLQYVTDWLRSYELFGPTSQQSLATLRRPVQTVTSGWQS